MHPQARCENLLVRVIGAETLVYDRQAHRAHRLNSAAAFVWHHCDGRTSVSDLAALLETESKARVEVEIVRLALERLAEADLLQNPREFVRGRTAVSRRQVLRNLAAAGAAPLMLPVVTSITAPSPAVAQYGGGFSCCRCANGRCFNGLAQEQCQNLCASQHGGMVEFSLGRRCGPQGVCI